MFEFRSGLAVSILLVALVSASVVSMAVDRRAGGGGELSGWSSAALDVAVPVQKMIAMPADAIREVWINYVDLLTVRDQNDQLRDRLASLEEENLQLREALVARRAAAAHRGDARGVRDPDAALPGGGRRRLALVPLRPGGPGPRPTACARACR